MANLAVETWMRFLVWLVLGLVVYFGYGRRHSVLARGSAPDRTTASGGDQAVATVTEPR